MFLKWDILEILLTMTPHSSRHYCVICMCQKDVCLKTKLNACSRDTRSCTLKIRFAHQKFITKADSFKHTKSWRPQFFSRSSLSCHKMFCFSQWTLWPDCRDSLKVLLGRRAPLRVFTWQWSMGSLLSAHILRLVCCSLKKVVKNDLVCFWRLHHFWVGESKAITIHLLYSDKPERVQGCIRQCIMKRTYWLRSAFAE